MSLLDSMIRRLQAQKAALEDAAVRLGSLDCPADAPVLEFGLGNGRTYDHLRELLPGRPVYVFDRQVAAHPECIPPDEHLFLGDLFDTLPEARVRLGCTAVMAHLDIGTGDKQASMALSRRATPHIAALLVPGALVVSDQPIDDREHFDPLPPPAGVQPGRIHLYRRQ
ncbi:MAG: hypothetical protein HQ481_20890 [Alphaproteobacteria bacterium]|nr:hypothetical protein [Alphaproteobacteria bacterium]